MRRLARLAATAFVGALTAALAAASAPGAAGVDRPDAFDHYLLALSWSPSWCETTGDARGAEVCGAGAGEGFTLHGLWPQHERGWPEYCASPERNPSRAETQAMADIMGSAGLAWHQWVKHGRCSGLTGTHYLALSRAAYEALALPDPDAFAGRTTPAALVESLRALNPDLPADGVVVTCREGLAMEVRVCLTRDLDPRPCAADVRARNCPARRELTLPPPR
jgi:ribonuclease T2